MEKLKSNSPEKLSEIGAIKKSLKCLLEKLRVSKLQVSFLALTRK